MDTTTKIMYYGHDRKIDQIVERYIERDVLANQSFLIDDLLKRGDIDGFDYEAIENLYPDADDMDLDECEEYCEDYGIEKPADEDVDDLEAWREAVRDGAEAAEILEWWLVSPWLARQLRDIGQPLLEIYEGYGAIWWGRTCSGQAIAVDPTFYEIYARLH